MGGEGRGRGGRAVKYTSMWLPPHDQKVGDQC